MFDIQNANETSLRRVHRRDELSDITLTEASEAKLRRAYETFAEGKPTAFTIDGSLSDCAPAVVSSLHRDHVFPYVSSYMDPSATGRERIGSANVKDPKNDTKLRADVSAEELYVTPRSENVPFETFRDYLLYLHISLNVDLKRA